MTHGLAESMNCNLTEFLYAGRASFHRLLRSSLDIVRPAFQNDGSGLKCYGV